MRIILSAVLLALLLPIAAHAQTPTPAKCGPLELYDTIQMVPLGSQEFVPITLKGVEKYFLFDTARDWTAINLPTMNALGLRVVNDGSLVEKAFLSSGFTLGRMHSASTGLPISFPLTANYWDGILALDFFLNYDVDIDFSTDTLKLFSQDHCAGNVVYWTAPAVGVVPITLDRVQVTVPVELDGQKVTASIDTGATKTILPADFAQDRFHLALGDADTPGGAKVEGDLKIYNHVFKSLTFGDVAVVNPRITIIGLQVKPHHPELTIGMDVLSKLHIYMALKEGKMYVSAAPTPATDSTPFYPQSFIDSHRIVASQVLKDRPNTTGALGEYCFWSAVAKTDLDGALADCDKAIQNNPKGYYVYYCKGVALYQQGQYQDAERNFDTSLKLNPEEADTYFMRGHVKSKLGDQAGADADIAAAIKLAPNVQPRLHRLGLDG